MGKSRKHSHKNLHMEHLNLDVKKLLNAISGKITKAAAQRCAQSLTVTNTVLETIYHECEKSHRSGYPGEKNKDESVKSIAAVLLQGKMSDIDKSERQKYLSQNQRNGRTPLAEDYSDTGAQNVNVAQGMETSTPLKGTECLQTSFPSQSPIFGHQPDEICNMEIVTDPNLSVLESESSTIDLNKTNMSLFTDDEESNDECSLEEDTSLDELTKSVLEDLNDERQSYSDSMRSSDGDSDDTCDEHHDIFPMSDDEQESDGDELQHANVEHVERQDISDAQQSPSTPLFTFGPHQKFSRGLEIYAMKEEYSMVQEMKFVCSLNLLLGAFQARCQTPGCTALPNIRHHFVGVTLIVNCVCSSGHKYRFCSSNQVNDIYANDLQAAASLILSGSNYAKVERMAKFLNLQFLSKTTYYRYQRLYLIPEINRWWSEMRSDLLKEFYEKDVVIGGDGQCDSPGFNAKNLCYFMVEVNSNCILDIEILDKRHVGLISTNMEKEAVQRSLDRLTEEINVVELVTDASTSVKALLGELYKLEIHLGYEEYNTVPEMYINFLGIS
ncbi:Hypothetical predicted protein [Paramuricea clavata]|uniref:Uncharacterized protein n=1 Tax=Paramuricea clavata TaxID=317549 RepID=A0A6S7G0D0_PARCT|nr:Hypothetical predicted protein [Paramuricea clavata]